MRLFNYSYLKKIFHDQKIIILLLILFSFAFEYLFAWLFFESKVSQLIEPYFNLLPSAFRNFLGVQAGTSFFGMQMLAFGYSHPLIIICLSFFPISIPTRYISQEIEMKTFDVIFSKPIQRFQIPVQIFIFLVATLALQMAAIFFGTVIGYIKFNLNINLIEYAKTAVTGYFFYLSMGALALAISTFFSERGRATAIIIGLFVILYFFDTIIRLNESLQFLHNYSYFQLYQPGKLVLGKISVNNCIIITGIISVIGFSITLIRFNRRDL
jgi:ABC-type transport system involved in multi-copper enzyme maturation permease subunit